MNSTLDTVTISRAYYEQLTYAERQLRNLESNGVDNWEGYSKVGRTDEEDE